MSDKVKAEPVFDFVAHLITSSHHQVIMEIYAHTGGPVDTNGYLVVDEESRQAIVVDAPEGAAAAFVERAERDRLQVLRLVLTHGHWDHIMDALFFRRAFQCPIAIHAGDAPMLQIPQTELFALPFSIPPFEADELLEENETLSVGALQFAVLPAPGHSPGGICLYRPGPAREPEGEEPRPPVLFAGDTLFAGSYGRLDLPGADAKAMAASLARLADLPPETVVYSGHGPATTIAAESGWLQRLIIKG